MNEMYEIQNSMYAEGYNIICGVDEAGRGPLAGPVYAAAVILPRGVEIQGLADSKKLSAPRREALFDEITSVADSFGIAFATVQEIEARNILNATYLAMNRAMDMLEPKPELALIDGNQSRGITYPCRVYVKGDDRCALISAASILAKVARDRYMDTLAEMYPNYGFEKHRGYGTKVHYAALREHGITEVHRRSFLKKLIAERG